MNRKSSYRFRPATRFESRALSQVINDRCVVEAFKNVVPIIVRRPHAYNFKRQHSKAPTPGIAFLNGDGELVGTVRLPLEGAVDKLLARMEGKQK